MTNLSTPQPAPQRNEKLHNGRDALTALFDACFRIQREASEAAGRYIPLVIENVRGAQPWVGRAKWNYGSYFLWGDVPALMPSTLVAPQKRNPDGTDKAVDERRKAGGLAVKAVMATDGKGGSWLGTYQPGKGSGRSLSSNSPARKAASALIAKIPYALAEHIGRVYYPHGDSCAQPDQPANKTIEKIGELVHN